MIYDKIINIDKYEQLLSKKMIQTIKNIYYAQVQHNDLNFSIFEYKIEDKKDNPIFECHYRHIDCQIMIEGSEYMYYANSSSKKVKSDVNYKDDYQLFESNEYSKLLFQKGEFIVFFPEEIHSPKHYFNLGNIKRVVIKEEI